jgi:uncharacterized protein (UPF0335 family)
LLVRINQEGPYCPAYGPGCAIPTTLISDLMCAISNGRWLNFFFSCHGKTLITGKPKINYAYAFWEKEKRHPIQGPHQGYSEGDIISALKNEGYRPREVDSAMREALKSSVKRMPPPRTPFEKPYPEERLPRFPEDRPVPRPGTRGFPGEDITRERRLPRELPPRPPKPPEPMPEEFEDEIQGVPRLPEIPRKRRQEPQQQEEDDYDDLDSDVDDLPPPPEPIEFSRRPKRPKPRPDPLPPLEDDDLDFPEPKAPRKQEMDAPSGRIGDVMLKLEDIDDKIGGLDRRIKSLEQKKSGIGADQFDVYQDSIDELTERIESVEKGLKNSLGSIMKTLKTLTETIKVVKKQTAVRKRK